VHPMRGAHLVARADATIANHWPGNDLANRHHHGGCINHEPLVATCQHHLPIVSDSHGSLVYETRVQLE
jgi:hypothetical protein